MREDVAEEFLFDPQVVQLNHASYGFPSRRAWQRVAAIRRQLELDPQDGLGSHLVEPFERMAATVRDLLSLEAGRFAFTLNATEAHETLRRSLEAGGRIDASLPADAYESMRTAWEIDRGGQCERGDGRTAVRVPSLVASSTARLVPADELEQVPGGFLVVDAAHGPGHVALPTSADAVFGTLHKWLPAVRSVGFLWVSDSVAAPIVPAISSLRQHDAETLTALLSWRGTWDPAPVLGLDAAVEDWLTWRSAGLVAEAEALADAASGLMAELGFEELNPPSRRAPRLRAFVLPGVGVDRARDWFRDRAVNVWLGEYEGQTILRIALNVYNDTADIDRLCSTATTLRGEGR